MWTSSAWAVVLVEEAIESLSVGTPISKILLKTSDALSLAWSAKLDPPDGLTATTSNPAEGICSNAPEIDSNKAEE